LKNAVDGSAMAAVFSDLLTVFGGLAAYRCPPQTNQLAGWFFCALTLVFCLVSPVVSAVLSEFKALKAPSFVPSEVPQRIFPDGLRMKFMS